MKCEKFTDDRRQTTDDGRQVMAFGPGELKKVPHVNSEVLVHLKNIESPAYCLFSSLISHNAKGKQEL